MVINTVAIRVMKAVWGQGHGRERSCGMGNGSLGLNRLFELSLSQLGNCPREYALVNAKSSGDWGLRKRDSRDRSAA